MFFQLWWSYEFLTDHITFRLGSLSLFNRRSYTWCFDYSTLPSNLLLSVPMLIVASSISLKFISVSRKPFLVSSFTKSKTFSINSQAWVSSNFSPTPICFNVIFKLRTLKIQYKLHYRNHGNTQNGNDHIKTKLSHLIAIVDSSDTFMRYAHYDVHVVLKLDVLYYVMVEHNIHILFHFT